MSFSATFPRPTPQDTRAVQSFEIGSNHSSYEHEFNPVRAEDAAIPGDTPLSEPLSPLHLTIKNTDKPYCDAVMVPIYGGWTGFEVPAAIEVTVDLGRKVGVATNVGTSVPGLFDTFYTLRELLAAKQALDKNGQTLLRTRSGHDSYVMNGCADNYADYIEYDRAVREREAAENRLTNAKRAALRDDVLQPLTIFLRQLASSYPSIKAGILVISATSAGLRILFAPSAIKIARELREDAAALLQRCEAYDEDPQVVRARSPLLAAHHFDGVKQVNKVVRTLAEVTIQKADQTISRIKVGRAYGAAGVFATVTTFLGLEFLISNLTKVGLICGAVFAFLFIGYTAWMTCKKYQSAKQELKRVDLVAKNYMAFDPRDARSLDALNADAVTEDNEYFAAKRLMCALADTDTRDAAHQYMTKVLGITPKKIAAYLENVHDNVVLEDLVKLIRSGVGKG